MGGGKELRASALQVVIYLSGLLALGCGGVRLVTNPTQRFELQSFSILPPQGENWYFRRTDRGITFLKRLMDRPVKATDSARSFYAAAIARETTYAKLTLPEFRELVERSLNPSPGGRFRPMQSKVVSDNSLRADCMRYDSVQEERDNPRWPGFVLVMTIHGFTCLHPYAPGLEVNLFYSERYVHGDQPVLNDPLKREVELFLGSVLFKSAN